MEAIPLASDILLADDTDPCPLGTAHDTVTAPTGLLFSFLTTTDIGYVERTESPVCGLPELSAIWVAPWIRAVAVNVCSDPVRAATVTR